MSSCTSFVLVHNWNWIVNKVDFENENWMKMEMITRKLNYSLNQEKIVLSENSCELYGDELLVYYCGAVLPAV